MSAWSAVTLLIDGEESVYDEEQLSPTQFALDDGVDEQGWIEADSDYLVYYALSFGRYQNLRFERHMEEMHCPKFSGVTLAHIVETNDTGDNVEVQTYLPRQLNHESRVDGYTCVETFEGKRFPDEERGELKDRVMEKYPLAPVIEPRASTIPPDMVMRMPEEE